MKEHFTKLLNLVIAIPNLLLLISFHIILFYKIPMDLLMGDKLDFFKWFIAYKHWWRVLLNDFGLISKEALQETQEAFDNLLED